MALVLKQTSGRGASTISATSDNSLKVERLLFYNHTECECQDRADTFPRDAARQVVAASEGLDARSYMRLPAHSPPPAILAVKPHNQRSFRSSDDMDRLLPNKGCRCPTEYSVRFLANGTCVCDCFDRQRECLRFKKGKNSFSEFDRNCVMSRECREPVCEFGAYITSAGRCPIKWEQYGMVMHSLTPIYHAEPKPVEQPKPPVAPPPASPPFSWSPKPTVTERPLHWTEQQKMEHHQKPSSPWDTHKPPASSHSDSKTPSSLHLHSRSQSRIGSYPSWAEPHKPAPASHQAHRSSSWGTEQSKATLQQYPSWSTDSNSRAGYSWSRTETRPSTGGGFPWNPAETARKQAAVTSRATVLAREPAKPAPSST
ncbi:hypothetical protein B566_EDAN001323 [Ephemera danica]|nr:hypothetical protein B566_EDAN001323 [Ephemera danica]